jgi:hypothetical protein
VLVFAASREAHHHVIIGTAYPAGAGWRTAIPLQRIFAA